MRKMMVQFLSFMIDYLKPVELMPGPECHRLSLLNQYIPIVYRRFSTESEWPKGTLLAKYVQYKSRNHFFSENRMNMMIWVFHNVHSVFRKKWNFRMEFWNSKTLVEHEDAIFNQTTILSTTINYNITWAAGSKAKQTTTGSETGERQITTHHAISHYSHKNSHIQNIWPTVNKGHCDRSRPGPRIHSSSH